MIRRLSIAVVTALTSLATAQAQFTEFTTTLTPEEDGGEGRTGTGAFTLSLSGTTVTLNGTFSGLSGTSTAGHIHGPSGPFPESAGVLYNFATLGLTTFGGMEGTVSGSFSLVELTLGGNPYTVEQQLTDLNNSLWYINIHSSPNFGGGEIRGQLVGVPEPSTTGLLAAGAIAGLMLRMRRRKS